MSIRRFVGMWIVALVIVGGWGGVVQRSAAALPQDACGDPATPIHVLQGTGPRSPEGGNIHVIEGVVVGDYQDTLTEFSGFFVQEEDSDADADPATSEGIFVFDNRFGVDVRAGDVVRVQGTVFEYDAGGSDLTELRRIKSVTVCSSGASVTPVEVTLPVASVDSWESLEGMLVSFPQTLVVSDIYDLGRYGNVLLSAGGRLVLPTQIALPGDPAAAVLADDERRSILLDDGDNTQNRDPVLYPAGGLSATQTLRAGDTVSGLTAVVDHRFGSYCLQPVGPITFVAANPRPAAPEPVGGRLRVASMNVLNYFNGDGAGGGFPTARGANTAEEFTRQRDKIISALVALDADVIALMEIENDGSGPDSAVADLVNGLNEQAGAGTYDYIRDPEMFRLPDEGADEIKVALIYRTAAVKPVGEAVTTFDAPFGTRRPPLVQAFEEAVTGERFIVAANHFKSKSCTDARDADRDQDDGQSCYNAERVQAAQTLTAWLATDPTGSGDPDVLIVGDLNAYAMEDPIHTLEEAGYTNLTGHFGGAGDYSYLYYGQMGTIDYALANESLLPQATGAVHWHINADEPHVLDYNVEYKSEGQIASFYSSDPYRASDHDPLIVGLALGGGDQEPSGDGEDDDQSPLSVILLTLAAVGAVIAALVMAMTRRLRGR